MAAEVEVRAFRAGDGEGCARAWLDAARYYVDRDPENFHLPAEAGLAEWFEQARAGDGPPVLRLVATVAGQVAGLVVATLEAPLPDARFQLVSAAAVVRVYVNALVVAGRYRRTGVGTALMKAVERWGESTARCWLPWTRTFAVRCRCRSMRTGWATCGTA